MLFDTEKRQMPSKTMPRRLLAIRFDETASFSESEWAVFRTYALVSTMSMADVAGRHGITAQKAGRVYRAVLAELIRRAERHGAIGDVEILRKNPRRSGRTAEAWAVITWLYRQNPAPKLRIGQHPCCWLEQRVAARLEVAGYTSLSLIVESLNRYGIRWHEKHRELSGGWAKPVSGMGTAQARQIASWLSLRQQELGVQIEPYAVKPRTPTAVEQWRRSGVIRRDILSTAPVPLERFAPHPVLSGRSGRNRAPQALCQIEALDDLAAIRAWLSQHPEASNTWRLYCREIERFLAWSLIERKKAFSSVGVSDCTAYRDWLLDPQPASRWRGPVRPRWHSDWRPFQQPLSRQSALRACRIVRAGMEWLVSVQYLATNPWAPVNLRPLTVVAADGCPIDVSRAFSTDQISKVVVLLNKWERETGDLGKSRRLARQRFIVLFGILTGVRLAEYASLRLGDLRRRDGKTWLSVLGKGQRRRDVPVPATAVDELARYLISRGLSPAPADSLPETPLIAAIPRDWQVVDPMQCMSTSRIGRVVKELFQRVADSLDGDDRKQFSAASAHWMRHTYGSRLVKSGADVTVVQKNLGHASLRTTSVYLHDSDDERWMAVQSLEV